MINYWYKVMKKYDKEFYMKVCIFCALLFLQQIEIKIKANATNKNLCWFILKISSTSRIRMF